MVSKTCWFLKLKTAKKSIPVSPEADFKLKRFCQFCCCMKVSFSTIEWKCFLKLKNGKIIGNYFCPEILRGNWSNMWWLLPQCVRVCACVIGCVGVRVWEGVCVCVCERVCVCASVKEWEQVSASGNFKYFSHRRKQFEFLELEFSSRYLLVLFKTCIFFLSR